MKKIVRQGNKGQGYTIMIIVDWEGADRAFRFDVERKWKKTLENYDEAVMGFGFTDTLKAAIKFFLVDKSSEIIGYDRREASKYEEVESEGEPHEMSVTEAAHTHSGSIIITGMIVSASRLYQLIKSARWRCLNCNAVVERVVKNILDPPTAPKECMNCEGKELEGIHEFKNAISLGLQEDDIQKQQNALDDLEVVVFDDDTNDIQIGECVKIIGDIKKKQDFRTKHYRSVVLAQSIEYEYRQKLELTPNDVRAINHFRSLDNYKQRMVNMFAPNAIGLDFQKYAILLSAIGAPEKRAKVGKMKRGRVHALMIGPPGTGKTLLGQEALQLRLNLKYVSGKNTTGKSMTAMVLNENEKLQLHIGPVPLAKNAICLINEFDKVPGDDQDSLLEVMDEGTVDVNKFAKQIHLASPTTIVATANPVDNKWISENAIGLEEIPFSSIILNRFDIILVFRDTNTEEKVREYAYAKTGWDERNIAHNYRFLQKIIEQQRTINPYLTPQAEGLLNEYYVKLKQQANFASNNRTLDIIHRIGKATARFYLKSIVDEEIAIETISFMNRMLGDFQLSIHLIPDPFMIAYEETIRIIQSTVAKENVHEPIRLIEDGITSACDRNEQVKYYLGTVLKQNKNRKLRALCAKILENKHIIRVSEHPTRVIWKSNPDPNPNPDDTPDVNVDPDVGGGLGDVSDIGDKQKDITAPKNEKYFSEIEEGMEKTMSPTSPRSPNTSRSSDTNNVSEEEKQHMDNSMPWYVHRFSEHSDRWYCDYCKIRDDRHGMARHVHSKEEIEKRTKTRTKTTGKKKVV